MREEYQAIADAGIMLQLDCPDLAAGPSLVDAAQARALVERNVNALNRAVRNISPELLRLHICWGNYDGRHEQDVELRAIIGRSSMPGRPDCRSRLAIRAMRTNGRCSKTSGCRKTNT
jgi:methionine synthase II (cobalamin-independent)